MHFSLQGCCHQNTLLQIVVRTGFRQLILCHTNISILMFTNKIFFKFSRIQQCPTKSAVAQEISLTFWRHLDFLHRFLSAHSVQPHSSSEAVHFYVENLSPSNFLCKKSNPIKVDAVYNKTRTQIDRMLIVLHQENWQISRWALILFLTHVIHFELLELYENIKRVFTPRKL